jgi:hypothetical protein
MTAIQTGFDLGLDDPRSAGHPTAAATAQARPAAQAALAKGVVYTKPWVASLILDLAGYQPTEDLAARYAVEPSAGGGRS